MVVIVNLVLLRSGQSSSSSKKHKWCCFDGLCVVSGKRRFEGSHCIIRGRRAHSHAFKIRNITNEVNLELFSTL